MQERIDDIRELGAEPLGISLAAAYQARDLMENHVEYDLLLDPDRNFKTAALTIPDIKISSMFSPVTAKRYLAGRGHGVRQGKPTAGPTEPPGLAIIEANGTLRYLYQGETVGDYPSLDVVMAELRKIAG